jgi:hypothetical protein
MAVDWPVGTVVWVLTGKQQFQWLDVEIVDQWLLAGTAVRLFAETVVVALLPAGRAERTEQQDCC